MSTDHNDDRHVPQPAAAAPTRRTSVWLLVGAVAVATLALIAGLVAVTGAAPDPGASAPPASAPPAQASPPATPEPSATTSPPASAVPGELTTLAAEEVLASFLSRLADATSEPGDGLSGLSGLASGSMLLELQNEQFELADNGWSRTGTEEIISLEVTEAAYDATPPTATVEVCIDSTDVVVLDSAGKPISSGTSLKPKRSINIYTLALTDGQWHVTNRTFPDSAGC